VKAKVIPLIIRTNETISKSLRKYLSNISEKHEIKKLQMQTYWTLHTYCGKYECISTKHISHAK
jgi:hypothetical protein